MKITTLAAAAALTLSSTFAFAQATNAPGASSIGGDPNPMVNSPSQSGGSATQTGGGMSGGGMMQRSPGTTTGNSMAPMTNDASKSGAPASDNAQRPGGSAPNQGTTTR